MENKTGNKQYLDFLYEERAKIQSKIDELVEANKTETVASTADMMREVRKTESNALREHIKFVNDSIELYLKLHTF